MRESILGKLDERNPFKDKFWTVAEACQRFNRSEAYIRSMMRELGIQSVHCYGSTKLYDLEDEARLEERINHPKRSGPKPLRSIAQIATIVWQLKAQKGIHMGDKRALRDEIEHFAKNPPAGFEAVPPTTTRDYMGVPRDVYDWPSVQKLCRLYGIEV